MNVSNQLNAMFATVVLIVMFTLTSSTRTTPTRDHRSAPQCESYMACAWAICPFQTLPYDRIPMFLPYEEDCVYIENRSCQCANRCQRTDLFEPGRNHVKFEYRCLSPEVTKSIFPMSWQRHLVSSDI